MKKFFSMLIILSMLLSAAVALAEDGMGVQVIGGQNTETEPVSLDDIKLNAEIEIEGYATITPTSFAFQDGLGAYKAGQNSPGSLANGRNYDHYWSGTEAEYAILFMDMLNITAKPQDYLANCEVKVVYDDSFEYAGWYYQRNYDNYVNPYHYDLDADKEHQNTNWAINAADQFSIDPMYQGHYIFGCTLPNAVVDSKKPLRLVITIDGNELTYNIRK